MQPLSPTSPNRDARLWQLAKARTKFQGHLVVYVLVNGGLWLLWACTGAAHGSHEALPWPAWMSIFWGIGLVLKGRCVYNPLSRGQRTQRAHERLLSQQR